MDMLRETGYCSGIENYSRYLTGRPAGAAPPTLFEYLPKDALLFVGVPISVSSNGYLRINADNWLNDRYLHRFVLKAKKGENVDHINGNKLDNRKENLRKCTRSQNFANRKKYTNNTSGYKGVSKHGNKWQADIQINGKSKYLGIFELEGGLGCYKGQIWAIADGDSDIRIWESSARINTQIMLDVPFYGPDDKEELK